MKKKFTDIYLKSLKAKNKRYTVSDTGCAGLYLFVGTTGVKTFVFCYRLGKNVKQIILGRYDDVSINDARAAISALREDKKNGVNIGHNPEHPKTVKELVNYFHKNRLQTRTDRSAKQALAMLNNHIVNRIGSIKLNAITPQHCAMVIHEILASKTMPQADNVLRLMKQMFKWAFSGEIIKKDPCKKLDAKFFGISLNERDNFLSMKQIASLFNGLDKIILGYPRLSKSTLLGFKILLLTGVRGAELWCAKIADIDIENKCWHIVNNKSKRKIDIPLNNWVCDLLKEVIELAGDSEYLFPSRVKNIDTHIDHGTFKLMCTKIKKLKDKDGLILRAGGWTTHDLRRTFASHLQEFVTNPLIIEKCLNHSLKRTLSGAASAYMRHDYFKERMEVMEKWEAIVFNAVYNKGNVIKIANNG